MNRTFKAAALVISAAAFSAGSLSPAVAATNQATLNVSATVSNNCDVLTQPATLTMTYEPIQNVGTPGSASYTWICTTGLDAQVTPVSANTNSSNPNDWVATAGTNTFNYLLYNSAACGVAGIQITNGTPENLGPATGNTTTYSICGVPDTSAGEQNIPAGTYTDTVTFTFNFPP
ncbi:MAG: spore coat protein U domain-containing protein [Candidatus Eremiobacteraeota bacterium]|nr:spore coat protein U domain-containing protein [Candidatus Eremiobacteraeota bacterium]